MRKKIAGALVAAAALAGTTLFVAAPAGAITVSDEAGLRAAFADAAETQIDLANDISLTDCAAGDLDRTSATALTVNGNGFTITQTCTDERVMENSGTGELALENVTITGGNLSAGNGGGGVWSNGGGLIRLTNATITGNSAPSTGGGGVNGEDVIATNSTISNNQAADFGGGMNVQSATLINSTVSGNESAGRAGGIGASEVSLTNSTVTGNTATGVNGGNGGGGVYVFSATLVYSTVVGNTASQNTNVYAETGITSFASVVALPQGGGENCGGGGTTTSNGFNFSDDASCAFGEATDRQNAGDPGLGALASNGGPTQTRLPQPGSPLIDGIPTASCQADGASGVTTDQRGVTRPQAGGCDIGSVEVEAPAPPTPPAPPPVPGAAVAVPGTVRFTG
jgi:hypothetical protein